MKPRERWWERILIAGLGDILQQDDGVGVHAVRMLQERPIRGNAIAVEIGTAALSAAHLLEWADRMLVIDAINAGGEPGTIYLIAGHEVTAKGRQALRHELSLRVAFQFIPVDRQPEGDAPGHRTREDRPWHGPDARRSGRIASCRPDRPRPRGDLDRTARIFRRKRLTTLAFPVIRRLL